MMQQKSHFKAGAVFRGQVQHNTTQHNTASEDENEDEDEDEWR